MSAITPIQYAVRAAIAAVTGHQPVDLDADQFLESDLGIDSIKMVELAQTLMDIVPEQRRAAFMANDPSQRLLQVRTVGEIEAIFAGWGDEPVAASVTAPVLASAPPVAVATAHASGLAAAPSTGPGQRDEALFAAVARVTGHRTEDLEPDLFLESDLGIDSIKMVELVQALLPLVADANRAAFEAEVPVERLLNVRSLRDMAALLAPWRGTPLAVERAALSASAPVAGPRSSDTVHRIDLLHSQLPFLVGHWTVSTCSLVTHVRLAGDFDRGIARAVWSRLLARHPALRARFEIPAGAASFRAYAFLVPDVLDAPEPDLVDLVDRSEPAREAMVDELVEQAVNHVWPLDGPLLHRLFVVRLAPALWEVFFTNHHLISDGMSTQQVMREFLAIYGELAGGRRADLPAATSVDRYREVVEAMNAWQSPAEAAAATAFLRNQGRQPFHWSPTGAARPDTQAWCRNHRFHVDPATTAGLQSCGRILGVTMNTLLVAAFLRAVADMGSAPPKLLINVPTSGRVYPGVDAGNIVSCFAQNLTLGFSTPTPTTDWADFARAIQQEVDDTIAAGIDRAQIRQAALFALDNLKLENGRPSEAQSRMVRANLKSNLYLPYIGNTQLADSYGPLRLVDYQAATVTNPGTLDTLVELVRGGLSCTTNYDAGAYPPALIARLTDDFVAQLRQLVSRVGAMAPTMSAASPAPAADPGFIAQLLAIAADVTRQPLAAPDATRDIEADLGIDSLERIRVVSRAERLAPGADRRALLACRSLAAMSRVLAGGVGIAAPALSATPVTAPRATPPLVPVGAVLPPAADDTVLGPIAAQARLHPDAIAVLDPRGSLGYADLDRESNRLAHALRVLGVGRADRVGVLLERGPRLLVAVLGILKAGAAYVPLDPSYPADRLGYMAEHARLAILVTEQGCAAVLAACRTRNQRLTDLVCLDAPGPDFGADLRVHGPDWLARQPAHGLAPVAGADDPMVVLYTSGSTGRPKGVLLRHRGYVNRFAWMQQLFPLAPGSRVAQKTSVCFDISVWELLWPLMHGATICPVATETLRDPWRLVQWVRHTNIQLMHFVPSLFGEFLAAVEDDPAAAFPALRQLVFSGEALPVAYVRRWMLRFGNLAGLANLYGPTEASIDVTAHCIDETPGDSEPRISIGRAMPNCHLLVLDDAMKPLPPGAVGELWIGGVQLAEGYLFDPERTAEAFRPNPFPNVPGPVLYRTGDLAVCDLDGNFDYRGRVDTQVKIRGYRVELGEIEVVLGTHPGVREAAVVVVDAGDGHQRIVAWLSGQEIDARILRDYCAERLPHYMLPHRFAWLTSLPKNQNGKIDRKALRAPGQETPAAALAEVFPKTADFLAGPAQHWLFSYFDAPWQWAGFTRFSFLQPLDIETFNRALNVLAEQFPALRSVFERRGAVWHQRFPALARPVTAEMYDGSHLAPAARDAAIGEIVAARVRAMRPDSGEALWTVVIVRESDSRHDICIVGHHLISDMLANGVLFRQLWRVYGALLANQVPTPVEGPAFGDYLEALETERRRGAIERHVEYWTGAFPEHAPAFELPVDFRRGENVEASAERETFSLDAADLTALQQLRGRLGCKLYPLLLAPLYRVLAEWSGSSRVTVSHRTHGRDLGGGRRFFETVGNLAVNWPLAAAANADWTALLGELAAGLDGVPLGGVSYDLVAHRLPARMYPDIKLTPVRANYLGNRELPTSPLFEFASESWDRRFALPEQKRISLIEVFFSLHDGRLDLDIEYSRHFHAAPTIRHIGERYVALLRELAATLAGAADATPAAPPASIGTGPLAGKVAVITGAGRGIGRAIAATLARQGARVALLSRSRPQLDEALAETRAIARDAIGVIADVTRLDEVEAAFREIVAHFGGIDILVNNAGINQSALLSTSDPAAWRQIVDVNLFGNYHCCRTAVPYLVARGGGRIINLGSAASTIGYPLFSAYSASKHAVIGLTKALAEEVKRENIQVNAVCPAFVDTRMTPQAFRATSIPPDDIAQVVAFLASPAAASITGETLSVFGKQDMYSYGSSQMAVIQAMTRGFQPGVTA